MHAVCPVEANSESLLRTALPHSDEKMMSCRPAEMRQVELCQPPCSMKSNTFTQATSSNNKAGGKETEENQLREPTP